MVEIVAHIMDCAHYLPPTEPLAVTDTEFAHLEQMYERFHRKPIDLPLTVLGRRIVPVPDHMAEAWTP
jgi:hypothetical protein